MNRRNFLKFAGAAAGLAGLNSALASTWQKVGVVVPGQNCVRLPMSNGRVRNTVACGDYHTLALRSDGNVFACGYNNRGRLGINNTTSQLTFIQSIGISNAIAVACGYSHTLALRSDGNIFACGYNGYGQLGVNNTTNQSTFVQSIGI